MQLDNTVHPMDALMKQAKERWNAKLDRQSKTVSEAVVEYKRRYHIDPPEGDADWFSFAKGKVDYRFCTNSN